MEEPVVNTYAFPALLALALDTVAESAKSNLCKSRQSAVRTNIG